jgi:uncharacterized protein YggE
MKGKSKMSKTYNQQKDEIMSEWFERLTKKQLLDKTKFIIQPIYSYENEDGSKVYDVEEMQREFDYTLERLESEVE